MRDYRKEHFGFDAEQQVMDRLLSFGYPRESIIHRGQLNNGAGDFLIIDVDTKTPLMIVEVKQYEDERVYKINSERVFEQVKRSFGKSKAPEKVIVALVRYCDQEIEFIDLTDAIKNNDRHAVIYNFHIPSYEILTLRVWKQSIKKQIMAKERKTVPLKIVCWVIIPLVSLALIQLDYKNLYIMSDLKLITIGACMGCALIPCFKEIKIGDVTIKNALEKQKEESI